MNSTGTFPSELRSSCLCARPFAWRLGGCSFTTSWFRIRCASPDCWATARHGLLARPRTMWTNPLGSSSIWLRTQDGGVPYGRSSCRTAGLLSSRSASSCRMSMMMDAVGQQRTLGSSTWAAALSFAVPRGSTRRCGNAIAAGHLG